MTTPATTARRTPGSSTRTAGCTGRAACPRSSRTNAANVSPAEVEAALYANPDIKVAAVVGVPDESLGELVVACVVPKADALLTEEDIRAQLKGRLASYKIPARVFVLDESQLELTATGKPVLSGVRSLVAARMQT